LLNDNHDEKVEHDLGTNHHVGYKEYVSVGDATSFSFYATISFSPHTVSHYYVPILTCGDSH